MSSSHKITQLDRRYAGSAYFAYIAENFRKESYGFDYELFINLRNWCWEVWGPSMELDLYFQKDLKLIRNPHWAWRVLDNDLRLYFKGTEETSMFQLKWG